MTYPLPFVICGSVQVSWVAASAWWASRRGDEIPLITSLFLCYVFSFRLFAILNGWASPVDISQFGFQPMGLDEAMTVIQIAVLGECVLLFVYTLVQTRRVAQGRIYISPSLVTWLRSRTWLIAAFCIPTALVARWLTRAEVAGGSVLAFESSAYLYLYPFVLVSVAILVALVWKAGGFSIFGQKLMALFVLGCVAVLTFGPNGRFQFLGWIIACTIIFSYGAFIGRKALIMCSGILIALVLFGIAGALRGSEQVDFEVEQSAWERVAFATDANMLDGFAILKTVYPDMLRYEYGRGHLEILERPIPRAWWPGKPVGGYMNKLGLTSVETGGTVGISPSLLGSFYEEGGVPAVIIFSVLYGVFLGSLVRLSTTISVVGGILIRAIICAFLIPLLRGGDLPGMYAWAFMSFWPCYLLLWLGRHELLRVLPPQRSLPMVSVQSASARELTLPI